MTRKKPASLRKIRANQENSKNSRGPTTPMGKWRSSQNAIVHALYAKREVLLGESAEERDELAELIISQLRPLTPGQDFKVWQIIDRVWRMMRGMRIQSAFIYFQIAHEVLDRKYPPDYEYAVSNRAVRSEEDRFAIFEQHRKELVPTEGRC
jgi:hypothetical protein